MFIHEKYNWISCLVSKVSAKRKKIIPFQELRWLAWCYINALFKTELSSNQIQSKSFFCKKSYQWHFPDGQEWCCWRWWRRSTKLVGQGRWLLLLAGVRPYVVRTPQKVLSYNDFYKYLHKYFYSNIKSTKLVRQGRWLHVPFQLLEYPM